MNTALRESTGSISSRNWGLRNCQNRTGKWIPIPMVLLCWSIELVLMLLLQDSCSLLLITN